MERQIEYGKNGGWRPNSGRKKGPASIEREKVKAYIAERIAKDIEPIVDALIKKSKRGDTFAVREIFDRGFGKATTMLANDNNEPLRIQISEAIAQKHGIHETDTGAE